MHSSGGIAGIRIADDAIVARTGVAIDAAIAAGVGRIVAMVMNHPRTG
jgi:hypothetical protein